MNSRVFVPSKYESKIESVIERSKKREEKGTKRKAKTNISSRNKRGKKQRKKDARDLSHQPASQLVSTEWRVCLSEFSLKHWFFDSNFLLKSRQMFVVFSSLTSFFMEKKFRLTFNNTRA